MLVGLRRQVVPLVWLLGLLHIGAVQCRSNMHMGHYLQGLLPVVPRPGPEHVPRCVHVELCNLDLRQLALLFQPRRGLVHCRPEQLHVESDIPNVVCSGAVHVHYGRQHMQPSPKQLHLVRQGSRMLPELVRDEQEDCLQQLHVLLVERNDEHVLDDAMRRLSDRDVVQR